MLETELTIGTRQIANDGRPYVIAEIGSNFDQSLDTARRLIDMAARAGADCAKFQLFEAEALYPKGHQYHELFRSIELNPDWLEPLRSHCTANGLDFMASAFDPKSVIRLAAAGVAGYKIASSETTNLPLVSQMAATGLPIVMSTGMCDLVDVVEAVNACRRSGNRKIALLQCGAVYPLPVEMVNLRVLDVFRSLFACPVGFSDHTLGMAAAIAAVGRGAAVIEKHVTLDRQSPGPDHSFAMEPDEFQNYVHCLREAATALGTCEKDLLPQEREYGRREGLYSTRALTAGHRLSVEDIQAKRPALGIRSRYIGQLAGARLSRDLNENEALQWSDLSFLE